MVAVVAVVVVVVMTARGGGRAFGCALLARGRAGAIAVAWFVCSALS